ncbi:ABC transporter permease subunit [Paenibacillus sp. LMG 31461]|uniref:ABC transporter permease subunit n=1 Tax=Paenibacillus plantarum TaxID=2654975 RepID=A0ABX1XLK7_9BACL|nr:ABC transporter permease subunit [Paenibacillus plantarum]NOU69418.1 ABC transporter permease subunit [Paenibacillus plantarum]
MRTAATTQLAAKKAKPNSRVWKSLVKHWDLYLMSVPGLVFLIIFRYTPMYGIVIAFKDYNIIRGVMDSPWIGFEHFRTLFAYNEFPLVIRNTLIISFMKLGIGFPAPILLAILINEMRNMLFKRMVQTVTYIPHFISWVVVGGIFIDILSPGSGIVNSFIKALGGEPIYFMADTGKFRWILVFSESWKEAGWAAIIYLAAILGINSELYQASIVDGANRFKQVWHIMLPGIRSTIIVILLLRIGHILDAGLEQVLIMYNPAVLGVADIIDTYVFRVAFGKMEFGLTAAAGLFKSVIGCLLLITANWLARRMGEEGVY